MKIKKQCDICGNDVNVDNWGNGKCKVCGWHQNDDCLKYPNAVNSPNFVSLNEAKDLYKNNKSFLPSFERFSLLVARGFDISFIYDKKRYQVDNHNEITLWEMDTENYITFDNIQSFMSKAKINDKLIKDIWSKVKSIRYEN